MKRCRAANKGRDAVIAKWRVQKNYPLLSDKFKQIDRGQNKTVFGVLKQNWSDVLLRNMYFLGAFLDFRKDWWKLFSVGLGKDPQLDCCEEQAVSLLFLIGGTIITCWSLFWDPLLDLGINCNPQICKGKNGESFVCKNHIVGISRYRVTLSQEYLNIHSWVPFSLYFVLNCSYFRERFAMICIYIRNFTFVLARVTNTATNQP